MKRNHGTTKKKYDYRISTQNEPHIHRKRLLHFLSCFWLTVNFIAFAVLLPDIRLHSLLLAFVIIFYAFIQQIDDRRGNWAWWGIVFWAVLAVAIPVYYALSYELYPYLIVIAAQIAVSTVIFFIFKKN